MVRAVIYTDFDGVLNAFPDDKALRRGGGGHTQWLKEGDPRFRGGALSDHPHTIPRVRFR